jgi:tRNA-specific 2-thiouridylase
MGSGKGRVVVAMSGGVDSSTAAYLLLREGYEVLGVSLDLYDFSNYIEGRAGTCCSLDDIYDARAVADHLGIPHYVFNYRDIFDGEVIENFIGEYSSGRTPNPCIICNDVIKFQVLLSRVKAIGSDYIATGHFAMITSGGDGEYSLHKGIDGKKDQSYFLYRLNQETLPYLLFPCGGYTKGEVRAIADEAGLPVKDKGESQEICFITENSYRDFLKKRGIQDKSGEIVSVDGRILGEHRGIHGYTVGQRKGIGVSVGEPVYVVYIDPGKNRVVVGPEEYLFSKGALASSLTFVCSFDTGVSFRANAKVRYRAKEVPADVYMEKEGIKVLFDEQVKSVTPGQSLVLYDGNRVLGGGIIERAIGAYD